MEGRARYLFLWHEFLGAFAKLQKATISVMCAHITVRPHEITRLSLEGFSRNLIFECLSKICRESSSFVKIWQKKRVLYTKTFAYLSEYLAEFFSDERCSRQKVVEKFKTYILCSISFFRKSCHLWYNVETFCTAGQATDGDIIRRMRFPCWIDTATDTYS
jgi:hypothetical protein